MFCLGLFGDGGSPFWSQFWPDLLATLVGAFVGIWLALKADHARERTGRDRQEEALLHTARDAVQTNVLLCVQLKPMLDALAAGPAVVPTIQVDPAMLDVIVPRLAELSADMLLVGELNDFRYQLHHVNRKLDHLVAVYLNPPTQGAPPGVGNRIAGSQMTIMARGITTNVDAVQKSARDLFPLLGTRLDRLREPPPWWRRMLGGQLRPEERP